MSVYTEILSWSLDRPMWQRDALRMLVTGDIAEPQIMELENIVLQEHGFDLNGVQVRQSQPLAETDLPSGSQAGPAVSATMISKVSGVNLIDPTSVLEFGSSGITIIYGDNGSGKSGFSRIFKRICRARDGGSTIYPDVFEDHDGSPCTATISYNVGEEQRQMNWVNGVAPPLEFGNVSIFDSSCAELYVTKDNEVAYRPFGLDLLDKLSKIADSLKLRLDARLGTLPATCPVPPELVGTTELRDLTTITATPPASLIDKIAPLTHGELAELAALTKALEDDEPAKRASGLRARKGRVVNILNSVRMAIKTLDKFRIEEYVLDATALYAAREEQALISNQAFADLLPGTGDSVWKALWYAARSYAAIAYPGRSYPVTGADSQCLLCQQELSDDAKSRMASFEEYVRQRAEQKLDSAHKKVTEHLTVLSNLANLVFVDDDVLELKATNEELAETVASYFRKASLAAIQLQGAFASNNWSANVPEFDELPLQILAESLETQAASAEAPKDADEANARVARIASLKARAWICENSGHLKEDIKRAKQRQAVNAALQTTSTNSISRKSTDLTTTHVTDSLISDLETELANINAGQLNITLTSKSSKGSTSHKVDIRGRKLSGVDVKDIVSEGEFRAIALAAFFAELSRETSRSAIVVDDPVSSLDHKHRERVACRLVKEATNRQVVVFTHDVFFMQQIITESERQGSHPVLRYISRGSKKVGNISSTIPWSGQKVSQRLDTLRNRLAAVKKAHAADYATYEPLGRDWYGHLRETWEAVVEQTVTNSCVERLRLSVETTRLKKVTFGSAEYAEIDTGMTKSSRWLRGHSAPVGDTSPFPDPSELEADFNALNIFVNMLKLRYK